MTATPPARAVPKTAEIHSGRLVIRTPTRPSLPTRGAQRARHFDRTLPQLGVGPALDAIRLENERLAIAEQRRDLAQEAGQRERAQAGLVRQRWTADDRKRVAIREAVSCVITATLSGSSTSAVHVHQVPPS